MIGVALLGGLATPPPAAANLGSITGLAGNLAGSATGAGNPVDLLTTGTGAATSLALGGFASGVLGGASSALQETAHVISRTTAPRLQSTWFSSAYWRVAELAALLTLPFLFAASAQALLRADPMLLARSVFGYLPLAVIAVNLAAPITMLLLSASDEMSSVIAGAGMGGGVHFLQQTAGEIAGLSALDGSAFLGIAVGLLTLAAAVALAVEMLIREAAVYVVVLMLPLAFAGLIWPARRSWAVRLIELLVALILSKFVIVAVLSLAGAAYGTSGSPTATRLLTAMTLVLLSTFAPWVMLRLLPFTELAAGAAGGIRGELPRLAKIPGEARAAADTVSGWAESLTHVLRHQAGEPEAEGSSPVGESSHRGAASAAAERLPGQASRAANEQGSDEVVMDPDEMVMDPPGSPHEAAGVSASSASGEARTAHRGPASGGSSTSQGDLRGGPFSQMEPMWQFEELSPSWITLDGAGVRRVAGPESPLDPMALGSEPEEPPPGDGGDAGPGTTDPGADEPR